MLASLVRKILLVGFFALLVAQWHTLIETVVNGFAALGLKAGGGGDDRLDLHHLALEDRHGRASR